METGLLGFLNLCSLRPRVESLMNEGIPSSVHQVQDGEALVTGQVRSEAGCPEKANALAAKSVA